MRKLFLFVCLLSVLSLPAFSQQFESSITGSVYAGTTCATTGACTTLRLPLGAASASINLVANAAFTGTVTFEASADNITFVGIPGAPAATGTAVSTTTAAGTWRFSVSGFRYLRVRVSAYTSGRLNVFIVGSTAPLTIGATAGP
jgi:hypothetical protein